MARGIARSLREERGVTLAELALTLALCAVISVGVTGAWQKAQEGYFVASEAGEAQQNLRAALDLMVREVRAAGRDLTACAFDYAGPASRDCTPAKADACRIGPRNLGAGGYTPSGCQGIAAVPFDDATATTLRIRSDRNDSGTIAGTPNASGADASEENVRYARATTSPPCPPGVAACLTRDDGTGPVPLVAVDIAGLEFTYYPRPGFAPCDAVPPETPCPPFALPFLSQRQADNIGRIGIRITAQVRLAGQVITRSLAADVALRNRS